MLHAHSIADAHAYSCAEIACLFFCTHTLANQQLLAVILPVQLIYSS